MASSTQENLRVTLLGTGTPNPVMDRFGPSTLVEAGGEKFLFDAGRGATQRLFRAYASFHSPEQIEKIIPLHTTPEQGGEIFTRVKPQLAVYSHIGPPAATAKDLIAPTRKTYSGPLEVGEDLMSIEVGERVEVRRFTA